MLYAVTIIMTIILLFTVYVAKQEMKRMDEEAEKPSMENTDKAFWE